MIGFQIRQDLLSGADKCSTLKTSFVVSRKLDNYVIILRRQFFYIQVTRCIFSKCGLFEQIFIDIALAMFSVVQYSIPMAAEISQSVGAYLIGLHVPPWPGMGTDRIEITWGATGNLFVSFPPCSCQLSAL